MGPGLGDQPLQVPGEPLGELLVISPDGPWHPPALVLRPGGQEWAAPQGRCCCSRKDPWSPQSPPGCGSTPAPTTRVRRSQSGQESWQPWPSTHLGCGTWTDPPRLESQPGLTLGPWLPRATQGLESAEGRLGGRLGPCHHGSSLSIRVPGLPVRLRSTSRHLYQRQTREGAALYGGESWKALPLPR